MLSFSGWSGHGAHCLSAPAIDACTNQRWKIRKTMITGTMVITAAAEMTPQFGHELALERRRSRR